MISKYPITSENNKKYKVKFKRHDEKHLKLTLYKRVAFIDFPVMDTFVSNHLWMVGIDFALETRKIVEMYEHKIGIGKTTPISIVKFLEWDGELRSLKPPKPPVRPVAAKK